MIHIGDALTVLRTMPSNSVQCCITSPPYWGLRDYGTATWEGGDAACEHRVRNDARVESSTLGGGKLTVGHQREGFSSECPRCGAMRVDQQIGLEENYQQYIAKLVAVFSEVRRVLRADGTLWINVGDSYSNDTKWGGTSGGKNYTSSAGGHQGQRVRRGKDCDPKRGRAAEGQPMQQHPSGLKPKDLMMIPHRLAIAMQENGWYVRMDNVWAKPNPMPESVTDRCTKSHEYVFLMSKSERYYYDQSAIKEPSGGWNGSKFTSPQDIATKPNLGMGPRNDSGNRNKRSVWTIPTQPHIEAETYRRVRVRVGAACDGSQRITSPGCPVHGDLPVHTSSALCGEHEADSQIHNEHTSNDLGLAPLNDYELSETRRAPDSSQRSSDSSPLSVSRAATDRSTEKNRTVHAPETKSSDIPCAQILDGIERTPGERGSSGSIADTAESNRPEDASLDVKEKNPSVRTPHDIAGICTCEHYIMKTDKIDHYAAYPEELVKICLLAGSREGDIILDPFTGRGTTGVVAERFGRQFIGIELSPVYASMAQSNLEGSMPLLRGVSA